MSAHSWSLHSNQSSDGAPTRLAGETLRPFVRAHSQHFSIGMLKLQGDVSTHPLPPIGQAHMQSRVEWQRLGNDLPAYENRLHHLAAICLRHTLPHRDSVIAVSNFVLSTCICITLSVRRRLVSGLLSCTCSYSAVHGFYLF